MTPHTPPRSARHARACPALARPALAGCCLIAAACVGALPAAAEGFDQGQAKSRIEAAGYADVAEVHEGNLGEWMAQAKSRWPTMTTSY